METQAVIDGLQFALKYDATFDRTEEAIKSAIAIINDSRIEPKKPHHTKVEYKGGGYWITDECPRCFKNPDLGIWDRLLDRHTPYCRRCGQAIDWSEYDGGRKEIDWDKYMARKERWEYE